jgi:hypothetical protein
MFAAPLPETMVTTTAAAFFEESDTFGIQKSNTRERLYPRASWLDALPADAALPDGASAPAEISAVNSDDNGLYRMFIGISP